MFTVIGYLTGRGGVGGSRVPYRVQIGPGSVQGSVRVRALLTQYEGAAVQATPIGPVFSVDVGDPASVLACLYAHTDVRQVEGEVPAVFGTRTIGGLD